MYNKIYSKITNIYIYIYKEKFFVDNFFQLSSNAPRPFHEVSVSREMNAHTRPH